MKKWMFILVMMIVIVIVAVFINIAGLWQNMSSEDLKAAIDITEVSTKWMEKKYEPWPPKLVLVPSITFRIKNISDKPLRYINFNANFRYQDDFENLGDSFLAAIRKKQLMPGETSDEITLISNYGVEGKNLAHFENNPAWKIVTCHLFAASKGSQYIPLGNYTISRKIDFKEPEPVGLKPAEKKKAGDK
jgi:hypothetical protein